MTGRQLIWAAAVATALTGCQGVQSPFSTRNTEADGTVRTVERDVEAPEVFQLTQSGAWDGKPSLGAVWIAHEDAAEPLRTIIRRPGTEAFVVGMLYKRSETNPGTGFQVSADAADALGLSAGEEARLDVVALVPEMVPEETPGPAASPLDAAEPIQTAELADAPIEATVLTAAPALAAEPAVAAPAAGLAPQPASAPAPGAPARPYVQIGIFSVEANAERAAGELRARGASAELRRLERDEKVFWRVIAGPAGTEDDLGALIGKAREAGFADAYATKG